MERLPKALKEDWVLSCVEELDEQVLEGQVIFILVSSVFLFILLSRQQFFVTVTCISIYSARFG